MKLEAQDVGFAYTPGTAVLHDVSLALAAGEILFLLGRNGSGKTTLLSCLGGVQKPTQGRVLLDGRPLHEYNAGERARRVGLIPQLHMPAFAYSVREMVLMGRAPHLRLFGSPSAADRAIADEALENVGLQALRERPYTEISGGERQLTLIARGLAQQCDVLLMDEPSAHLDMSNQHRVLEMVDQLARQGLSFIISSHAPNNALEYAGRVLLLYRGRVMAYGRPTETLTEPLLSTAYGLRMEMLYDHRNGQDVPRAVLAQRPLTLPAAALDWPDSPLAQAFQNGRNAPQLFIVTGLSGVGKTTWCGDLAQRARARGLRVAGLWSPGVFAHGRKLGIDLVNLHTEERRRLANLRGSAAAAVSTTQWAFDPEALAWGNRVMADAPDHDLLILDELGPLEFGRGEGLMAGLQVIDDGRYRVACVVIRPSLLPEAQARWPHAQIINPPPPASHEPSPNLV
ncbi:MAG: ATP-binding cassette domain-containing protein [Chloroflexi bacterium]|nr:ATP-binding cassette domain-containing protein [Chloroflexota bacterium]